ncbi:hypothetical protein REH59_04225 [Pseudomonas sp. BO3-4]|uniref:hypothetical protein n=1 Tax=Pseudomonas sp. BO3-4 TaxID=3094916 RepID=UPI002A59DC97|nr:hypothetical protein [Pseudomonas sp. BO3-4]WPO30862.1 hypothetical protein REH59_04225 [Pseudomonas sp. BO3-4]
MIKDAEDRCREILSKPRSYSDEDIIEFIYEFSCKTGLCFRYGLTEELPAKPIKEKIYFFASMLIYLNRHGGNGESNKEINVSDEDMKDLSIHIAFIISELSKDIK